MTIKSSIVFFRIHILFANDMIFPVNVLVAETADDGAGTACGMSDVRSSSSGSGLGLGLEPEPGLGERESVVVATEVSCIFLCNS